MIRNKLVRDKIPARIKAEGKKVTTFIINEEHFHTHLCCKLSEELLEFQGAVGDEERTEELADILEVVHALAKFHHITLEELEYARRAKFVESGGFDNRVYLVGSMTEHNEVNIPPSSPPPKSYPGGIR